MIGVYRDSQAVLRGVILCCGTVICKVQVVSKRCLHDETYSMLIVLELYISNKHRHRSKDGLTRLNSIFLPFWSKALMGANLIFAPDVLGPSSPSVSIAVGIGRKAFSFFRVFFVTLGILTVAAALALRLLD